MDLNRIATDNRIMGGVPCIDGTRIPATTIVGLVADGMSTGQILADFPQLTDEDVGQALRDASSAAAGERRAE